MFRQKRRGNLLLTAIFIAALLFFMCVVLVSTNRQDISLSLFSEHHLKAELAAESGLNQALQLMRSHSEWEAKLKSNFKGTLSSGAEWSAEVKPYESASVPAPNPYLVITGIGKSGAVRSEKRLLVEELRLADSIAAKGLKPHLFGLAGTTAAGDPTLVMLGPSMKWSTVAAPEKPLWDTFGCNGGPLSILRDKDTVPASPKGPELKDDRATAGLGGFYTYEFGPAFAAQFPASDKLTTLNFETNSMVWRTQPLPTLLAKVLQSTIDGDVNGKPRFETANLITGPIQVDVSDHMGPVVEWYVLNRARVMSDQDFVYCPATHHIFKGTHAKNVIAYEGPFAVNRGFNRGEATETDSAILKFDIKRSSWSVYNDCISYKQGDDQFTKAIGPRPDTSPMSLEDRTIVAVANAPQRPLIQASETGWRSIGANRQEQQWGIRYKGYARSLVKDTTNEYSIEGLPALSKSFPSRIPAITAMVYSNVNKRYDESTVVSEQDIQWTIMPNSTLIAQAGDELYAHGWMSYRPLESLSLTPVDKKITPDPYKVSVLMHYDGKHWQALPQGLNNIIWDPKRYETIDPSMVPISILDATTTVYHLRRPVGIAGYVTSANLMRRYVPLPLNSVD